MNPACRQCRTELPEGADGRLDLEALALGHAVECADCGAWVEQLARTTGALYGLERRRAPAELDGRVVAALEAGDRESRAVRAVEELSPAPSPADFADTVELAVQRARPDTQLPLPAGTRLSAPSVLERLVREELAQPEQFMVRRLVGSLPRQAAPAALDERVAAQLTRGHEAQPPRQARWGSQRFAWASLAAAALLIAGLNGFLGGASEAPTPVATARSFEVFYAQSLRDLDPVARSLVNDVSGGLLSARGL